MVKQTTESNFSSGKGRSAPLPVTISTASPNFSRSRRAESGSISTAVSSGTIDASTEVVAPKPGPISSTRLPNSTPASVPGRVSATDFAQESDEQILRCMRFIGMPRR